MSNFTPGPWHRNASCTAIYSGKKTADFGWTGSDQIFPAYTSDLESPKGERMKANADLLAAAPELLDALRTIAEFHRDEYGDGPLLRKAFAAMQKANGGAS